MKLTERDLQAAVNTMMQVVMTNT